MLCGYNETSIFFVKAAHCSIHTPLNGVLQLHGPLPVGEEERPQGSGAAAPVLGLSLVEATGHVAAPQPGGGGRRGPLANPAHVLLGVDRPHSPDEVAAVHRLSPAPPGVHLVHVSPTQEGPFLLSGRQLRLERKERGLHAVYYAVWPRPPFHLHTLCKEVKYKAPPWSF